MKKALISISVVLLTVVLSSCIFSGVDTSLPTETGDLTGSWAQINQNIIRPDNWKQIVQNSQFQLGEKKLVDERTQGYSCDYGTYPHIDGSTVCVPMAAEFAWQHLGLTDYDANSFVIFNTTDEAYQNLIKKEGSGKLSNFGHMPGNTYVIDRPMDIILVTQPSDDELALAKNNNVELTIKPVCYDAFVFITHKDNPVDSLTIEQIQKIYSGEITNWKGVGGLDEDIKTFQREENSGSQTAMEKQVMQGKKMLSPDRVNTEVARGMSFLVESVAEYKNGPSSIGYTFKFYLDSLYKNENIKIIKINGIEPTVENIRNGVYPFTTNYFGVIRAEDKNGVGGKFLDWILSEEGQKCIKQEGYCPITAIDN